jgi:hypothetical protein
MAIDLITITPRTVRGPEQAFELVDLGLHGTGGEDITIRFTAEEFADFAHKVSAAAHPPRRGQRPG